MKKLSISEELQSLLEKLKEKNENKIAERILNYEFDDTSIAENKKYIDYLGRSAKEIDKLSWVPSDRINTLIPLEEIWTSSKRIMAKPAKAISHLFPNEFSQRDIEIFTDLYRNKIKEEVTDCNCLKFVEGEDIRKYYLEKNSANYRDYCEERESSALLSSCMRGEDCQPWLEIYCVNKRNIGMAVMFDDFGKVKGRCILWYPKGKEEGNVVYYDRIYGICHDVNLEMQAMMEKLGYYNISDRNYIKVKPIEIKFELEYGMDDVEYYPYMDSMMYIHGKEIGNYEFNLDCGKMRDTRGGIENVERTTCQACGDRCNEDYYVDRGRYRHYYICEDCAVFSEEYQGYIYINNAIELSSGEYILDEDATQGYSGEFYYCRDVVELYDGRYAHENDEDLFLTEDDEYFIRGDENFVEIGDKWYNISSSEIEEIEGNYYVIGSKEYDLAIEQLAEINN